MVSLKFCKSFLNFYYGDEKWKILNYSTSPLNFIDSSYVSFKIQIIREGKFKNLYFWMYHQTKQTKFLLEYSKKNSKLFLKFLYFSESKTIFEDPFKLGYKFAEYLDLNHINIIVDHLAEFHTLSLRKNDLLEKFEPRAEKSDVVSNYCLLISSTTSGLCNIFESLNNNDINTLGRKLKEIKNEFLYLLKYQNSYKNVWCHGQLCQKNILFEYNGTKPISCIFFNFEKSLWQPPVLDLAFLVTSLQHQFPIDKYLAEILESYYDKFCSKAEAKEIVILKDFEQNYFESSANHCQISHYDSSSEHFKFSIEDFELSFKKFLKLMKILNIMLSLFETYKKYGDESYILTEGYSQKLAKLYLQNDVFKMHLHNRLKEIEIVLENDLITLEDVYIVLKRKLKSNHFKIESFKIENFNNQLGFLGGYHKLIINVAHNSKRETLMFFIKDNPKMETVRLLTITTGMSLKEYSIYKKILPFFEQNGIDLLQSCIPTCYLARMNDIKVFDDLKERNYVNINHRKSLTYDCALAVLKTLSKMHASVYILEEKLSVGDNSYRLINYFPSEFQESFLDINNKFIFDYYEATKRALCREIQYYKEYLSMSESVLTEKALKLADRLLKEITPSKKFRNTICHADLWGNNLLFNIENGVIDCKLVDFQGYRYNPPANDLLFFIYFTTDRKFRKKHMEEILRIYYKNLSEVLDSNGVDVSKILDYDEFLLSCEHFRPLAVLQTAFLSQLVMVDSKIVDEIFANEELYKEIVFNDRCDFIVENCEKDALYRRKLFESILDLEEICKE